MNSLLALPRLRAPAWLGDPALRPALLAGYDALATATGAAAAWYFRFDGHVPESWEGAARGTLPVIVVLRLVALLVGGLHRWSFRMPGKPEALRLLTAQAAASVAFVVVCAALRVPVPRSIYPLEFLVTTGLLAALRFGPGLVLEWRGERTRAHGGAAERTIVVGAGAAGELLARDLRRSPSSRHHVVGFVDDDRRKRGTWLVGRPVLGPLADLPRLIPAHGVSTVLVAITGLPALRVRELLALCSKTRARFKIVPACFMELDRRVAASMLHDLSPEDLLPRPAVAFDPQEIGARVAGRRALVTGAGGSIGSEIARQLAGYGAQVLVLVDLNENELYLTARQLAERHPELEVHAEVADVREARRLQTLGERYRPHFVFHAAAHKHVPLMEDAPEEAVKNNVFGTRNAARMAIRCGAERFVLISTDKAVKPTSIMGATKRVAEMVVRDLAGRSSTRMTAVRFGNVLGSAGSVVPIFKRQIEQGGPVTITHPDCTRYFMTIPEAVGLVLVAGLRCEGGLYVLDMGEPIRIVELAHHLITLAGRVPGDEIRIVFTGLRPGEKVREELLTEEEEAVQEVRDRIRVVARGSEPPPGFRGALRDLRRLAQAADVEGLIERLEALVPSSRLAHRSTRVSGTAHPRAPHASAPVGATAPPAGEAP